MTVQPTLVAGHPIAYRGGVFRHELSVRYGECDAQAVVFNAHYLAYCDHAMDEFLRAALGDESDLELMLKSAELTWHAPLRYRERVAIDCRVARWGTTSMTVAFTAKVDSEVRFEGAITYVAVDAPHADARPIPIPAQVRRAFDALA